MHPLQDRTMDTTPAPDEATGPIKNMRIRFWGVQGSCPIFPSLREVSEYARRIATHTLQRAFEERYGLFSKQLKATMHLDDPIDFRMMAATFAASEIRTAGRTHGDAKPPWTVRENTDPIRVGSTTVTPFEVYHGPTECLGFKVRHGSASFVFCSDHELRKGNDPADARQVRSQAAV